MFMLHGNTKLHMQIYVSSLSTSLFFSVLYCNKYKGCIIILLH